MGYEISLDISWRELERIAFPANCSLSLFRDKYEIRLAEREVLLSPCGLRANEDVSVLILSYLIGRSKKRIQSSG